MNPVVAVCVLAVVMLLVWVSWRDIQRDIEREAEEKPEREKCGVSESCTWPGGKGTGL
jgi:hypothetical protein